MKVTYFHKNISRIIKWECIFKKNLNLLCKTYCTLLAKRISWLDIILSYKDNTFAGVYQDINLLFCTKYVQQGLEIHGLEEHGPWRYTVFNWIPKHLRYTVFGQKPWRCTVFLRYTVFDQKPWRCTVFSFDVLDSKKVSTQHQPYN